MNVPQPAKNAPGLRVVPLAAPAKPEPAAWKEKKVLDLHRLARRFGLLLARRQDALRRRDRRTRAGVRNGHAEAALGGEGRRALRRGRDFRRTAQRSR